MSNPTQSRFTSVASLGEAEQIVSHLSTVMDALISVVELETELLRAGKLSEATKLEERKAELSRHYLDDTAKLQASRPYLAKAMPAMLEALRTRHEGFRTLLQSNLTVVATAHAVSESIIRGVSGELARKAAPSTYGATGRANVPSARASQPLAVCRSL